MNKKLIVLLGGVGAVHLVAAGLFLAGGCTQEDPPMPPGIYVPRPSPSAQQNQTNPPPTAAEPAGEPISEPVMEPKKAEPASEAQAEGKDSGHGDRLYVVVKNDSLWLIARKNGLTMEELASYNSLPANARLKVGQKIYIPAAGTKAIKSKPVRKDKARKGGAASRKKKGGAKGAPTAKEKIPADGIYTVKPGDNFSFIAKRYGLKVSDLLAANPGVDSSRLKVGQKIRLTAGAAAVPAAKAKTGKKAAKPAKAAKAAPAAKPAAAAPAAAAGDTTAAPADQNASKSADGDDLLKSVEDVKTDKAAEPAASNDAVNAAASDKNDPLKVVPEKDQIISESDAKTTVVVGENTTLAAFCKKYRVPEAEVRKRNPGIAPDGKIKVGTKIRLIGEED